MEPLGIEQAFTKLKPLCDSLMRNPNSSLLLEIENALENVSEKIVRYLFEYISFPLVTHLTNVELDNNVKERSVKTMQKLITIAKISRLEHLNTILQCLLIQMCDPKRKTLLIEGNEELKEAVIACVKTLLDSCHTEVTEAFYSSLVEGPPPKIGHQWIMLSFAVAKHERSRSLKIGAMRTLMTLCQVDDESDRSDEILQDQAADVILLMLPGILVGLQKTMMGSDVQSHTITVMALRAWSRIIALVTKDKTDEEDSDNKTLFDDLAKLKEPRNGESRMDDDEEELARHLKSKTRTKEWLYACAVKLNRSFSQLDTLLNHPNWKVRLELVEAIRLLLTTCSRNMRPNVTLLTDYLISLSEDESAKVRENAKRSLDAVNANFATVKINRPLVELLEENFYDLLTKLPTIVRRSDDADQLSCLNRIAGYLRLLGDQRLSRLMMSVAHVRRLIVALVHVSEIDYADVSILETVNANGLDDPSVVRSGARSWKRYKFIDSDACESKVREICRCLAESGDIQILADNITRLLVDMPGCTNELILLLNWIVDAPPRDSTRLRVYEDMVDIYVNPDFWYPPIEVDRDVPLRVAQRNVMRCCLLSEGLGTMSLNLDRNYERFLLKTLYLVVERAGNKNGLISLVAGQTLETIAKSQHCLSTSDLFTANMDYLSYNVRVKLRRVHLNPGCLDVIRVLIKHSTIDALSCLKDIVEDCLFHSNKNLYRRNSYAFLRVFQVFATCVKDMLVDKGGETITEKRADDDEENVGSKIVENVLEYLEAKKADDLIEEEIEETECEPQNVEEEEEEKKVEPPFHVKMIEQISRHCLHFVSSKNVNERLIAMSTLQDSLRIMARWEEELLPLVHSLWHPLVDRFNEDDPLIINRAWQLLDTIGDTAKDFIRSRTLKQVWPPLSKFLKDAAKESHMKTTDGVYRFTQTYKLQRELLSSLAKLTRNLLLRERETWDVLTATETYLNKYQNPVLQNCCVQLYKDIADYNGDIVFVKCLGIFHSKIARIPADATLSMKDLTERSENISRNEYSKNVMTLMKYIQERKFAS